MNIGIVTTWFERGAAYVSRAYRDILSKDNRVFIYARGGEKTGRGNPNWDKNYVTWGKPAVGSLVTGVDWNDFKNWIKQYQIKCVIFNEQHSWEVIIRCKKELNIAIGAYIDYYKKDTVPLFGLYDFLLCNTHRHYGVFNFHPRAFYIPWGTDISVFSPRREPEAGRKELAFFHSCGMSPDRKGTDLLLQAFANVNGKCTLIIHSQVSPDRFSGLRDLINHDPRVEWIEQETGAPGLYYLGDVYVYPTRLEGIGLTIAEALACGLPVITTDSPPMSEFIEDGSNGKLVKVRSFREREDHYYWPESICDSQSLTLNMQYFVDHNNDLVDWQIHAREYAENHLDWDKNSKTISRFLFETTEGLRKPDLTLIELAQKFEQSQYSYSGFLKLVQIRMHQTRFLHYVKDLLENKPQLKNKNGPI